MGHGQGIERIVRRTHEEARAKGRDDLTQTEQAVKALCRPGSIAEGIPAGEWVRL